jgi:hypothetical protein
MWINDNCTRAVLPGKRPPALLYRKLWGPRVNVDGFVEGKSLVPTGVRIPTHLTYTESLYGLHNLNPLTAVVYSDRGATDTLPKVFLKYRALSWYFFEEKGRALPISYYFFVVIASIMHQHESFRLSQEIRRFSRQGHHPRPAIFKVKGPYISLLIFYKSVVSRTDRIPQS